MTSRDPSRCPYWTTATRTAERLVSGVDLLPEQRGRLQDQVARALADAWETGVHEQHNDSDTITEAIADLKAEDFDG